MRAPFLLSGLAALAAQMIWARLFAASLGHEVLSTLATVAAVFVGLLAGGLGHGLFERQGTTRRQPARAYAMAEAGLAGGFILTLFLAPLSAWVLDFRYDGVARTLLTLVLPALLLLPATFPMGATLPLMDKWLRQSRGAGTEVGWVVGWNTLGSAMGCLVAVWVIIPYLGLRTGLVVCAVLSVIAGLLAWRWKETTTSAGKKPVTEPDHSTPTNSSLLKNSTSLKVQLVGSGLLAIGMEWMALRAMAQVSENTIYSFAHALSVYLLATALGAFWVRRNGSQTKQRLLGSVESLLTALTVVTSWEALVLMHLSEVSGWLRDLLPGTWWRQGMSEWLTAMILLGPPCWVMGMLFCRLLGQARNSESGIGKAVSWNLLGCVLAAPLFGLVVIPSWGMGWGWCVLALGYLGLSLMRWNWLRGLVGMAAVLPLVWLPNDLKLTLIPSGLKVIAQRAGTLATVTVLEGEDGHRSLRVNNRFQMGGTAALIPQRREGHLPLLLHPRPQRVLFLGPGTGITVGAALTHPALISHAVELVPEIIRFMPFFESANRGVFRNKDVVLFEKDALAFAKTSQTVYDVIVADLFHPAQEGTALLYSREHFMNLRQLLTRGGLVCQWLPLHQMDWESFSLVARTFQSVFSDTEVWMLQFNLEIPVVGLVGRADVGEGRVGWLGLSERMNRVQAGELRAVGFQQPWALGGCWVTDGTMLKRLIGNGPLNTQDRPLLAFAGPRGIARIDHESGPGGTMMRLLTRAQSSEHVGEAVWMKGADAAGRDLITSYLAARDHYFKGLALEQVQSQAGGKGLDAALEEHFAAVEKSLYFAPAYARIVSVIQVLAATDRARARLLYERLLKARPDQPLGRKMFQELFGDPAP